MTIFIDHVIYGTRDVDGAGRRFWREHGLASYDGGVHPQYGTGNRIVPLGDCYIEILGVADETAARRNPLGEFLLEQTSERDGWVAWCVRTDDVEATAKRIGSAATPGHRTRPDGADVNWTLTGLEIALAQPPLPFFISWGDPPQMPGREPVEHRVGAATLAWIEVSCDEHSLREHLGADLPVRLTSGDAGIQAVGLAVAGGEIVLK